MKPKNLREMVITTGSGEDVKNTSMLSGQAKPTAAWKTKNSATQYETGKAEFGALGGKNTGS